MIKINLYEEFKKKRQKEFDKFPKFFAFDEKQFKEGMKKLNLKESETDKIISIGVGGYIKKADIRKFNKMFERMEEELKDAIKNDLTGEKFIKDMFRYELANHEYGITYNLDDTLEALNLTIDEINNNTALKNGLQKAKEEYLKACEKAEHTEDEEFGN